MGSSNRRHANARVSGARDERRRGRACYRRRDWADAYQAFVLADQIDPLQAEDLELLAMSAYLTGRDDYYLATLERAYHMHRDAGERLAAIRCAFWIGLRLLFRGEIGRATGWLARAQRSLERKEHDCAEQGYLMLPLVEQHIAAGDLEAAHAVAAAAVQIGERRREADLTACARHLQGKVRIQQGQVAAGLALLDEAMIAVAAGELSPLMTGLIYCSVIDLCLQVYELGRAHEWTSALGRWCQMQPQIVAFTGVCQVHRAEIMQRHGAWRDAIEEARSAGERCQGVNRQAAAAAYYQQAEVHRLRGEFAAAEDAYRSASQWGLEPQPGFVLLRLAQARTDVAVAAIRRALTATKDPLQRARLLPAYIEIMLATRDTQEARNASRELEEVAATIDTEVLGATAAQARGAVELAEGDAQAALGSLRHAFEVWQRVEMPYAAARVRVLVGLACRAVGDEDGGKLELEAARITFEALGAGPDMAVVDSLTRAVMPDHRHQLTPRELQVLRLVAAGKTNKAIAATLVLSEKTVDRHVSNIFIKLDVPSRTAATAYAYEHRLI